jgi:hypothetical protein
MADFLASGRSQRLSGEDLRPNLKGYSESCSFQHTAASNIENRFGKLPEAGDDFGACADVQRLKEGEP